MRNILLKMIQLSRFTKQWTGNAYMDQSVDHYWMDLCIWITRVTSHTVNSGTWANHVNNLLDETSPVPYVRVNKRSHHSDLYAHLHYKLKLRIC